jgi:DNA mismatch repair protein MutL
MNKENKIQVLSDEMANKIAAGEVIERPASAVKELLENSIDAGATEIIIEIESAGKELIKISDNGCGMTALDSKMAFQRHATSKLYEPSDLEAIQTLGFRGEALPSIASVSKVLLTTSHDENTTGYEIEVEGGKTISTKEIARPKGTTFEIRELFYNTPARRKFLKRDSTEASHIAQATTQQALAHPRISFSLTHNGRKIINVRKSEQSLYRISEIMGADLTKELVPVEISDNSYHLEGFVSNPVFTRGTPSAQYFFVNNRFIKDKVILHAIQHGYSHLLPKGQYPVIFLYLTMDPKLVDVNVHPAKAEVRFAFQQDVHRFVSKGIRNAIAQNEPAIKLPDSNGTVSEVSSPLNEVSEQTTRPSVQNYFSSSSGSDEPFWPGNDSSKVPQRNLDIFYSKGSSELAESSRSSRAQTCLGQTEIFDGQLMPVSRLMYSEFEPLGQLKQSFIIMQGPRGILIVDQHIAHERILYERFRNSAKKRTIEVQKLLFPKSIEVLPDEAETLLPHLEMLGELGLELETFGVNGFLLRSVPSILKKEDGEELVRDIVSELQIKGKIDAVKEKYEDLVVMMSCRNAIKINHVLDMDQIRKLLYDLEQTEMPYTCPHGRPISLLIEMDGILKKFLRK